MSGIDKIIAQQGAAELALNEIRVPAGYADLATWNKAREYYVEVTLSSAQILAANTTAITAVTAPGANKMLVPVRMVSQLDYNTATYTGGGGGLILQYDETTATSLTIGDACVIGTADYTYYAASNLVTTAAANTINKPLTLQNTTTTFAAGDSSIVVRLWYYIVDFS